MSKEDRYAHLGDGEAPAERPADAEADAADPGSGIRVTIDDGDEKVILTVDPDAASVAELREAVLAASGDASPAPLAAGVRSVLAAQRVAFEVGLTGAVVAMEQASSAPFGYRLE
jgi:hypothetical protein